MNDKSEALTSDRHTKIGIHSREGLLLGIVIGFAAWLPFMLFSRDFLFNLINSLFGAVIVGSLIATISALIVFVFRKQIFTKLFGGAQVSTEALSNSLSEAIISLPDGNRSALAAANAVREAVALGGWFLARRAMLAVLIGMVGAVIAMLGTVLLLQQTEALQKQNLKLSEQTEHLRRQNEILAFEGKWELLWQAHYGSEASKLDAATRLALSGEKISGLQLKGSTPYIHQDKNLSSPIELQILGDTESLDTFPEILTSAISNAHLSQFNVAFDQVRNKELSRLHFDTARVVFQSVPLITNNYFKKSFIHLKGQETIIRNSSFKDTVVVVSKTSSNLTIDTSHAKNLVMSYDFLFQQFGDQRPEYEEMNTLIRDRPPVYFDHSDINDVLVTSPIPVRFRSSKIGNLQIIRGRKRYGDIGFQLSRLLGEDNFVKGISIGDIEDGEFRESEEQTAVARKWLLAYSKQMNLLGM